MFTDTAGAATLGGLANGVIPRGFTIQGIDNGNAAVENAAIYLRGNQNGVTIQGNTVVANGEAGLLTESGRTVTDITVDSNTFTGKTFVGDAPAGNGFGRQFALANVPRQLVVLGHNGGNEARITFTNNVIDGVAGGIAPEGNEQGNTLVTIDAADSVVSGNTFAGTTARFGAALRVRDADTDVTNNVFDGSGMTPTRLSVFGEEFTGAFSGNSFVNNAPLVDLTDGNKAQVVTDGPDLLTGTTGMDALAGGAGDDRLDGGAGDDTLDGGAGDDTLDGGAVSDTLVGGDGTDTVVYSDTASYVVVQTGDSDYTVTEVAPTGGAGIRGIGDVDTLTGIELFQFGAALAASLGFELSASAIVPGIAGAVIGTLSYGDFPFASLTVTVGAGDPEVTLIDLGNGQARVQLAAGQAADGDLSITISGQSGNIHPGADLYPAAGR